MAESGSAGNPVRTVQRSSGAAAGRGIALIALAVAIGVLLLSRGLDEGGLFTVDPSLSTDVTTTVAAQTEESDAVTPTSVVVATTTTAVPVPVARNPAEVKIFVANANQVAGIAKANVDALKPLGYNVLAPGNAPETSEVTNVFYAEGWNLEALDVAEALGIPAENVAPWPEPAPFEVNTATVVVNLGRDGLGLQPS